MNHGTLPPDVTEADYSYITSQDLVEDPNADDVLVFRHKAHQYSTPFPPYAIGDGKLAVKDIRERVRLLLDITDGQAQKMKMLYKGKLLKDSGMPVREYGVKNKSEILVMVPEPDIDDDSARSCDEEEIVVEEDLGSNSGVGHSGSDVSKSKRGSRRRKKKTGPGYSNPTSPHMSGVRMDASGSSVAGSSTSGLSAAELTSLGTIDKLNETFTNLLPRCHAYIKSPPSDSKKKADDHRKLTETILQHVILKLDGIEGDGIVRTKRRELVKKAQEQLNQLDAALGKRP